MIITLKGADFSKNNIGTLDTWTISVSGTGVTYTGDTSVDRESNTGFSKTITLNTDYELNGSVSVTMGGNDITADVTIAQEGKVITVSYNQKVTGAIVINVPTKNTATGEEEEPEIPDTPDTVDAIEFTFDSATENGVNLAPAGTLSNGVLTISAAHPIDYTGITFANDKDWTFECIALPSTATGLIPIGAGSDKGGFIQLPNPQGATTACLRFRDKDRTMSAEAAWTTGFTTPTHFAIVYSAANKTLKMYMDYQELTVAYSTGSINTFKTFTSAKLFGGYTDTYNYVGQLHYIRFSNAALSVSDFHRE